MAVFWEREFMRASITTMAKFFGSISGNESETDWRLTAINLEFDAGKRIWYYVPPAQ